MTQKVPSIRRSYRLLNTAKNRVVRLNSCDNTRVNKRLTRAFRETDKMAALIPFITAGFPTADSTVGMLRALAGAGADVIELGVPFSDPMADGPAIQRANEKALANGISLSAILAAVAEFRQDNQTTPIVLMGYANSFFNYSLTRFADEAAAAGVDGIIVVDLADVDRVRWRTELEQRGIGLISLIAPTTASARAQAIAADAVGFLYLISLRGVTGAKDLDIAALTETLAEVRRFSGLPLAVGFGVRTPQQAEQVAAIADGVVIGSRLVEVVEAETDNATEAAAAFIKKMAEVLRQ